MNTSTIIINPLTPIKIDPVKGPVALLTFGNVTIQLEQQIMFSLFSMLPDKKQFNRTVELLAAGFKEISREMQFEQSSKIPKEHRDSENKILLGMDNLLNPDSFITGDHLIQSENKTWMNDQRRLFFNDPLGKPFESLVSEAEKNFIKPNKNVPDLSFFYKDEGLIDFFVDGKFITTWVCEDDPETTFLEFCKIYWMGYNRNGILA